MPNKDVEERKRVSEERLLRLFNIRPSQTEETRTFRNLSHKDLCKACEYWVDQTKMIFGESVSINQIQSPLDAGVDIILDLNKSQLHFGIQVKSHGDIKEKNFSNNVHSQISRSRKHSLAKLVVAFGGDLTDSSQEMKIGGMISELHQRKGDDNYVFWLNPQQLMTIYKAYKAKEHPLKYVQFGYQDAVKLLEGIGESLSNEGRKAKVTIEVEDLIPPNAKRTPRLQFQFKVNKNDVGIMDDIANLQITGGIVRIKNEQIGFFQLYDDKGKPVQESPSGDFIIVGHSSAIWRIDTLTEDEQIIESFKEIEFSVKRVGDELHFDVRDSSEPFQPRLIINLKEETFRFIPQFNFAVGDAVQSLKGLKFIESLKTAKKVRFTDLAKRRTGTFANGHLVAKEDINPFRANFVRDLAEIQEYSGKRFLMPAKFTKQIYDEVSTIASILKTRIVHINSIVAGLTRDQALDILQKYKAGAITNKETLGIPFVHNLLGNDISIKALLVLSEVKPVGDVDELIRKFAETTEDLVELELVAVAPQASK